MTGARALVRPYRGVFPRIAPDAFIAETAVVIGDVEIGAGASVWYGCVLRGDVNRIVVGPGSNIQDGTVIHAESEAVGASRGVVGGLPTVVGSDVTVGHMALLHACTVESGSLVGMGAIAMDGSVVERGSILAAGSLLTPGKRVLSGSLWAGRPARFVRALTDAERAGLAASAERYRGLASAHRDGGLPESS